MQLNALLTGSLKPLGKNDVMSGIDKHPVSYPLYLGKSGFNTDTQADLKHHGGENKAVHHYAMEHYAFWRQEIGPRNILEHPGAFGENISTTGMMERDVAIGDTFRFGEAIIAVTQARQPCWKLNIRFDCADMAKRVQITGYCGWYYRVVEEGRVKPDSSLILLDRPQPDWPLDRLWRILFIDTLDRDELAAMAALPLLTENWRRIARKRLERQQTESWQNRLCGTEVE